MTYAIVEKPIAGSEAFSQVSDAAILSQAAFLLILGNQLRGIPQTRAARAGTDVRSEILPTGDSANFPVPLIPSTTERFAPDQLRSTATRAARLGDVAARYRAAATNTEAARVAYAALAQCVYETPTPQAAATLLNECIFHEHELVRTAAAAAYCSHAADPRTLIALLAKQTSSQDELTREVAATALARFYPGHEALAALRQRKPLRTKRPPSHTSMLLHGTWAAGQPWWQPGGDFHNFMLTNVRPDLYGAADRFEWSGGYSDAARAQAAVELNDWIATHQLAGLDLFTHSHGSSVAMIATQNGATLGKLVLLSCPEHENKYLPDFTHVTKVVSIRVHADLVILADGGGQRFKHAQIQENVLPCWFNHSATHDPATWVKYNVKNMI